MQRCVAEVSEHRMWGLGPRGPNTVGYCLEAQTANGKSTDDRAGKAPIGQSPSPQKSLSTCCGINKKIPSCFFEKRSIVLQRVVWKIPDTRWLYTSPGVIDVVQSAKEHTAKPGICGALAAKAPALGGIQAEQCKLSMSMTYKTLGHHGGRESNYLQEN